LEKTHLKKGLWWKERGGKERGRRMDVVQIMYSHVCKCKNDICLNCSRT
jgi:hypothetical protein